MDRTTITLDMETRTRLRRIAADRGISMAALIREAIDDDDRGARPAGQGASASAPPEARIPRVAPATSARSPARGADPGHGPAVRVARPLGPGSCGVPSPDRARRRAPRHPRPGPRRGGLLDRPAADAGCPGRAARRHRFGRIPCRGPGAGRTTRASASCATGTRTRTSGSWTRPCSRSWSGFGEPKLATLDRSHFSLLRPRHRDAIDLLPA